jgi:hypothetical protein
MLGNGVRSAACHITVTSWARISECRRSVQGFGVGSGLQGVDGMAVSCHLRTSFGEIIVFE